MSIKNKIPSEILDLWDDMDFVVFSGLVAAVVVFIAGSFILLKIYGANPPEIAYIILIAFSNLFCIFIGLISLKRREVPRFGLPSIKGFWAVFQAIGFLIFFGTEEILLLYLIIKNILQ